VSRAHEDELLEREGELGAIRALIAEAAAGNGGTAMVEGPPGIGKSRVLAATVAEAGAAGFEVARARASELERDFAFGLVRQLFEPRLVRSDAAERERLFAGAARLAAPLFELPGAGSLPGEESSQAAMHGLYWLTVNLAGDAPVALAVDDVHWADAPSLRFLAYLVNRVEELPILLAVAARPAEPGAELELLDELAASPSSRVVRPQPLGPGAVGALIRLALDTEPEEQFAQACFDLTGGNPLLLHELTVTLRDEHIAPVSGNQERLAELAPRSVVRSVTRRLRRLTPDAVEVAAAVAVLGDGPDRSSVTRLCGLESAAVGAAAADLGRADIFRPDVLEFAHPLVRAAVYSELPAAERAHRHRAAAELEAARAGDTDAAALHLLASDSTDDPWAIDVLTGAARRALGRAAPDVAATFLERALAGASTDDGRAELLLELGLAELDATRPSGFAHMREAMMLASDPAVRGRRALVLGRSHFSWGDLEGAADVFKEGLDNVGDRDSALRDELDAHFVAAALVNPTLAPQVMERIEPLLADPSGVSDPVMLAALGAASAQLYPPAWKGAELCAQALATGQLSIVDNPAFVALAAVPLLSAGRFAEAKQIWDDAIHESRRRGATFPHGFAWTLRASVSFRQGALAAAEADARGAFNHLNGEGALVPITFLLPTLIDLTIERGELDEGSALVERYGLGGPLANQFQMNQLLDSIGRLRLAQNRLDEGMELLTELGRRLDSWGLRNPGFIPWRSQLALALHTSGRTQEARTLVEEEIALAREFEVARELGMALRAAGLIEGGERGIVLLREAVGVLADSPAELEHARALTDLGATLRRDGQRSAAREPLRSGVDLAQRCGATALADRAHSELVASGARPRRLTLRGVDSLTASERRVAEMASEGLTNREIAQALFVTEKTVEGHLGHAYRKLDISSRSELPRALIRQPEAAAA
jgi:DNA-binding CsgD family transcriptional regulator